MQIARGPSDLTQLTQEQARVIEETAATMNQRGSTVRSNAGNTRRADPLTGAALRTRMRTTAKLPGRALRSHASHANGGRGVATAGLLLATPAIASKDGAAIGDGLAALARFGILTLLGTLALGLAVGALVSRWKQVPLGRALALSVGSLLLLEGVLLAAWFIQTLVSTERAVAHQRTLQPFRAQVDAAVRNLSPGQASKAIEGAMEGVPADERVEKGLILLSALTEHMQWKPIGWTQADTAAVAQFASRILSGQRLAATYAGHALAIDWLNGRESSTIACTGDWASACRQAIADGLDTACGRQFGKAESIATCAPAWLEKAKERAARLE